MPENQFQLRILYAHLIAGVLCTASANPETVPRPIVIEAFGFGIPEIGKPEEALHGEAIEDALKNAALQALVNVDMQVRLEDMHMENREMQLRGNGTADLAQILEAGFVTNSIQPIYRVHVKANAFPQPASLQESPGRKSGGRKPPSITLTVLARPDLTFENALRQSITDQLQERGIQIEDSLNDDKTIAVTISLTQHADNPTLDLFWEMESISGAPMTGAMRMDRIMGSRHVSSLDELPEVLIALVARLARNAERIEAAL